MDAGLISMRYARALLKFSIQQKQEDLVYGEMLTLAKSYIDVPKLHFLLEHPVLEAEEKEKMIITATGGEPSLATRRFISLVLAEGREKYLQFIANSYITLYRRHKNLISGKLITATAVSESTEEKMKQMVERRTNGKVEFETLIDPEIIGGFILEYDTYRLDASVSNQLRQIMLQLKRV